MSPGLAVCHVGKGLEENPPLDRPTGRLVEGADAAKIDRQPVDRIKSSGEVVRIGHRYAGLTVVGAGRSVPLVFRSRVARKNTLPSKTE